MTQNYLLCQLLYLGNLEPEKSLCGVSHYGRLLADTDGEGTRDVDSDVLEGKSALQVDVYGHGLERNVSIILN